MSGERFTLEQVLEATRAVVDEKGHDFVYIGHCEYAAEGEPRCIVGHAIHRLDPEAFSFLARRESEDGGALAGELIQRGYLPAKFWTKDAEQAMFAAQVAQDTRLTWGEALLRAENLGADAE